MFTRMMTLILATGIALWATGCGKSDSTPKDSTKTTDDAAATDAHAGHDHAEGEGHENEATTAADTGGQTLCPISGHAIDPDSFVEYKDKKVYFCCDGCIEKFNADPEKYVALLPQFGGKEDASKAEGS